MKKLLLVSSFVILCTGSKAQLKFIIDDFEGLGNSQSNLKKEGIYIYGSAKIEGTKDKTEGYGYSGTRAIKLEVPANSKVAGWGKGITSNVQLDVNADYFNFYCYLDARKSARIKLSIEEDDNNNNSFDEHSDDSWTYTQEIYELNKWVLVSIPLTHFKDANKGGDNYFNINYKEGKLLSFRVSFPENDFSTKWYYDFLSFSKGKLLTSANIFMPQSSSADDFCVLGTWSEEGNTGRFSEIPLKFEGKLNSDKKLGIVHFFQPFSVDKTVERKTLYPSPERITPLVEQGYIPMITLENQAVNVSSNHVQTNLYTIVEGHLDYFFSEWARRIKQVNSTVLVRILHEFNGDWYPWCISKNDNNPELYKKAFRHICDVFRKEQANNVKFVWCPNSMSWPQAPYNFIGDAYPGDEYVDFVALDVYNGTQEGTPVWRSFRREAIENYFILTQYYPSKPLLICEISSRERKPGETGDLQSKAEWIEQMSEALKTDLSKVRLLSWFNAYEKFKITSSEETRKAFLKSVWMDSYYKSGNGKLLLTNKTGL